MMMFREDYDKLCAIAPQEFSEPYFFQTEYTDRGSLRGHAQLRNSNTAAILPHEEGYQFNQGIFIDIFPLDNVVDNEDLFFKQYDEAMKSRIKAAQISRYSSRYIAGETKGIKGAIKAVLYPFLNVVIKAMRLEERYYLKFEKTCQKYNDVKTERVSTLSLEFANKQHFKYRKDFEEIIQVPFEFMTIPIGKNYDHALTQRFGDYMTIVKGSSLHGNVKFDTEKSYREYVKGE